MSEANIGDMDLATAINWLRGPVSFDRLAQAIDRALSSQSIQRMGDPARPFGMPMRPENLALTAQALTIATPHTVSWWALWVSHGISFERRLGLTGRPRDRETNALPYLPPGWADLTHDRFAALIRNGSALVSEQRMAAQEEEMSRLRAENDRLRARLAALESEAPATAPAPTRRRASKS